jgi:hypothetical protein
MKHSQRQHRSSVRDRAPTNGMPLPPEENFDATLSNILSPSITEELKHPERALSIYKRATQQIGSLVRRHPVATAFMLAGFGWSLSRFYLGRSE